jgi:uncharacterized protein YbjT (DUF2867 family)
MTPAARHLILGGTGNVGSAVARELLSCGETVTIVTRDKKHAAPLKKLKAKVVVADVLDVDAIATATAAVDRVFVLNPPADRSGDPPVDERKTLAAILDAVRTASPEFVVALSTYGAQPGERIGDLGVLYDLEQALAELPTPGVIVRAAYLMTNFAPLLDTAGRDGVVPTFFPPDFALPMVAPVDVAGVIADKLTGEPTRGIVHVEGPARPTFADVAAAFAKAMRRPVRALAIPRDRGHHALAQKGFSDAAADAFAAMTEATLAGDFPAPAGVVRGPTTLDAFVADLVAAGRS